jgi:hypothetical protein
MIVLLQIRSWRGGKGKGEGVLLDESGEEGMYV